ncbi:DNA mismatch repair protein MSH1, mitochondrial isoform X5 [Magnolia sinica]|uniref:DNA mismatch repair protein MSH1, mitochondrial isoform X5 n=1 Tax=Magnolia sinica TaxID=86752 RepID=UPI0026586342|nr:DNA mismatch repair protein MSH1, mitochondrial isoform X5 [Magnolia sinica]
MHWFAAKSIIVSFPRWRPLTLLLRRLSARRFNALPLPLRQGERINSFKAERGRIVRGATKATRRSKESKYLIEEEDNSHIMWWKEKMQTCKKPSSIQLVKRLNYSNLLGLDVSLKNGSLKEGTLNMELLQFKSKFPREVLLCRVGDFYEAVGFDACILVEHAGLNPFGGLWSDSIPRAGCPVMNLRQTLVDLTRNGFSVCIVEEIQGPTQARTRKSRFISGHAHPGSPYVFGLAGVDHDVDFPEPMPVVGISRSAKGYCMISVLETMKTFSVEDGLTEEAIVTKLRTCCYHYLFLHMSLRHNSSGTSRWGEFGEGGLLWGECNGKRFEWFDGTPVNELLYKVRELYGIDQEATFRNVTVSSEKRPRPLYLGTATQIGAIPTEGIPSLLKVLLPSNCFGLPVLYIRDLLLNPPPYVIASAIQSTCKLMSNITCPVPEFTCISAAKLVKLLESKEANHIEFRRIKNVVDEISHMYGSSELSAILQMLLDPTWVATGLKIECKTLVKECELISHRIGEIVSLDGEKDHEISSFPNIPEDFFEDMESSWKGRVKRVHAEKAFAEVERAAEALSKAVTEDLLPIILRVKAVMSPLGGPKGEISYAREHEAVWFKGKRFAPSVWSGSHGEEQIKLLKPATDSKGRKVGEEWFTTSKVEDALNRYHEACAKAKAEVLELLRGLSAELQTEINVLVFSSMLLVIARALFLHVSEGRRRKWVFPTLVEFSKSSIEMSEIRSIITGASPRSLVLMDEICRGTEMAKGTCIAGSIVEILDHIGCLGIISTHLHGIFDLPLTRKNAVYKAMGTESADGHTKPTWKLIDGICRESLAFETALKEGIPEAIIRRAEELYHSINGRACSENDMKNGNLSPPDSGVNGFDEASDSLRRTSNGFTHVSDTLNPIEILQKEVENAVIIVCQRKLIDLYKKRSLSELAEVTCVMVRAREQPPPSTIGASSVYVLFRPDKKLYVGQTDDLVGRVRAHRSKEGMENATCLYVVVPGKSVASELETLLINQLPRQGFRLTNKADGKHRNFGTSNLSLESLTVHQ